MLARHSDEGWQGQIICGLAGLETAPDRKVERLREALSLFQHAGTVYGTTAVEAVLVHLLAMNGQVNAAKRKLGVWWKEYWRYETPA
jgi:hypothetical protein